VDLPAAAVTTEPTLAGGGATFSSLVALQQDATCGVRAAGGLACWGDLTIVQGATAGGVPAAPHSVVGIDGAAIALSAGGTAGWGDFFPSGERNSPVPLALTFPAAVAEIVPGHTSEVLCGRVGTAPGVTCLRLRYAMGPVADWDDSSPGFGVPLP
jgi:hypothetical protein